MNITILGSGTSTGVPEIGCTCEVCMSPDPKDCRSRTSVLVESDGVNILLDCGPDFRQQMLSVPFSKLDAVLLSHEHYDHVGGIDDLRPFCRFGEIPIYADQLTIEQLQQRMPYCFKENPYPGVPAIVLKTAFPGKVFAVNGLDVLPIRVMHGRLPILGYRIGGFAYITDMSSMPEESYEMLNNLDVLVMNALRIKPHTTHQNLQEAIDVAECINARETYFIHMSHHIGLHMDISRSLPLNMHFAWDGLKLSL